MPETHSAAPRWSSECPVFKNMTLLPPLRARRGPRRALKDSGAGVTLPPRFKDSHHLWGIIFLKTHRGKLEILCTHGCTNFAAQPNQPPPHRGPVSTARPRPRPRRVTRLEHLLLVLLLFLLLLSLLNALLLAVACHILPVLFAVAARVGVARVAQRHRVLHLPLFL